MMVPLGLAMASIRDDPVTAEPALVVVPEARAEHSRATRLACLGVCVAAALVIGVIWCAELALPLSTDQALYSLIGRAIHHGAVPYRDFTDLKPPGIFYVRAALDVLAPVAWSGACFAGPIEASCGWWVTKTADLATTLLFAGLLYATARRMQLDVAAGVMAAVLGAVYVSLSYVSQMGLTPEKLAAVGALLAVLCATRGWWLLAGVAVGAAILMKQPSGTVLVPVGVLVLQQRARWRGILQVAAGLLGMLLLVGVVLAAQGALAQAMQDAVAINLERIGTPARLGGFGGDGSIQTAWQAFRDALAPFWLLAAAGAFAATTLPARWRGALLAWFLVDALLLLRLREFIQLAPSAALLGGWAATRIWRAAGQPPFVGLDSPLAGRLVLLGAFLSVAALSSSYQESIVFRAVNERTSRNFVRSPDELVADALAQAPPGPLFVWGNGTELYLLSNRPPASSSLNVIPLSTNLPGADARRAVLMQQLARTRPVVMVISPEVDRAGNGIGLGEFPELSTLLQQEYASVDAVTRDASYGGWRIYVLRAAEAA